MLAGLLFLVLGAVAFIPGITTGGEDLRFIGPGSTTALFGVFAVSGLHNFVHLLTGAVAVFCARAPRLARRFLIFGGCFYLALSLCGVIARYVPVDAIAPVNVADNWLNLGLGTVMIVTGSVARMRV
jgi:hypothetical protein